MGLLARAFDFTRRASPENPGTSLTAQWLLDWALGEKSDAGVPVSQASATRLTAVYRCVNVLGNDISAPPLSLMKKEGRGARKAREHPLYDVVNLKPNDRHTSFKFRHYMQANIALQGNGYAAIRRDAGGRIRQLWPIPAMQVCPEIDEKTSELYYDVYLPTGKREPWAASEMLHIPGLGFDGLKGMSVIGAAREAIGLGLAAQKYGATVFSRGGRIPGVIQTPLAGIDKDKRKNVREGWEESVGGPNNWLTPAILPKGWEWKEIGIKPEDGQWLETRKFQVLEICRMFGVNPHKVFDFDRATFTNFEHSSLSHVLDTVLSWVICWEQELDRKLLTDDERAAGYYFQFELKGLMRADTQTRGQFYALGRQWGFFSANDVRELEDMQGIGPQGDIYLVPFNMMPADQVGQGDSGLRGADSMTLSRALELLLKRSLPALPAAAPGLEERKAKGLKLRRKIRAAQRPVIEDRAAAIVRKEIGAIEKELKALRGRDPRNRRDLTTLRNSIDEFYRTHGEYAADRMRPILTAYSELIDGAVAQEIDRDGDTPPALSTFTRKYSDAFGKRTASEGRLQLLALIDEHAEEGEEEVAAALQQRLDEWGEKRPGKIAQYDSVRFMGGAFKVIATAAGVKVYVWAANPGACDFCASLDGKTAGAGQDFVSAGEAVSGGEGAEPLRPSENIGHGPLHGGCECDVVAG